MSFMEPEIVFGQWVEIEGEIGTEFIDADLIGDIEPYQGPSIPVPEAIADYCENRTVTEVKIVDGFGARFSAPGYLDRTEWAVFQTEAEAEAYLAEQQDDDD